MGPDRIFVSVDASSGLSPGYVLGWAWFAVAFAACFVPFALALASLHRASRWRGVGIVLAMVLAFAFYSGWAQRHGALDFKGFHVTLWISSRTFRFGIEG